MERRTKLLIAPAVAVPVLIVAGIAARGGDDDEPLSGDTYDRASAAALDHVGEGTVVETEVGDDGAAYGVEIERDDGSQVEVNLDDDFQVINVEADDDDGDDGDDD